MTFRRFIAWIAEKLLEWQLFVLLLLGVKFLLPTDLASYQTFDTFVAGAESQWYASLDEAAFITNAFMGGSYASYVWKAWVAAGWLVGIHLYFWSFYLFTSIFAGLRGPKGYTPRAVVAFLISAGILAWRQRAVFDIQALYLGGALLTGGLLVVLISTAFGNFLDARMAGQKTARPGRPQSARGRVRLDFSH
ncbi:MULTISPECIES: hypothetical protein [Asticcacaulis]|uniref:hypothetical protein n=1 Tax=Asticcacaulis TaxID=76890 RepID=UPI001AEA7618|nr:MULTISPECIES: hypothetical protein [Asticcacaulis]MBP2160838.1 hypothetical protein [Asticcacaulis solisilvae]MDR6801958.1 hypothetical protein [Asticcacaulis sp. BE141]